MKQIALGTAALVTGLVLAVSASAVDIQNADDEDYQITVVAGETSQALTLPATAKLTRICEEACVVRIEGLGEIEVEEQEIVLIQGGEITKQPKEN